MNSLLDIGMNEQEDAREADHFYDKREEEVVKKIYDGDNVLGTITQNFYGCLMLSVDRVMFIDVDLNRGDPPTLQKLHSDALMQQFRRVSDFNYWLGLRVYRTAAGYRLIVSDHEYEALDPKTRDLFTALKADPVYVSLCQKQECFRARLTPKPWRVGMVTKYYQLEPDEQHAWRYRYEVQAENYGVCEYVTSLGNPHITNDSVNAIIEVHDRLTIKRGAMLA